MAPSTALPPKKDVALALLQGPSVFVHLDPRRQGVVVPKWLQSQPQLVLQVVTSMAVPIIDLEVGEEAISCTLSFSRSPFWCYLPWPAVYALVSEDGRGMVWPEDVPPELGRPEQRVGLKVVDSGGGPQAPDQHGEGAAHERPRLRAVPEVSAEPDDMPAGSPSDAGHAEESPRKLPPYLRVVK